MRSRILNHFVVPALLAAGLACPGCSEGMAHDAADRVPDRQSTTEVRAADGDVAKVGNVVVRLDRVTPQARRRLAELTNESAATSTQIANLDCEMAEVGKRLGQLNGSLEFAKQELASKEAEYAHVRAIWERERKNSPYDYVWPTQPPLVQASEVFQLERDVRRARLELPFRQQRAATLATQQSDLECQQIERKQSLAEMEAEARTLAGSNG